MILSPFFELPRLVHEVSNMTTANPILPSTLVVTDTIRISNLELAEGLLDALDPLRHLIESHTASTLPQELHNLKSGQATPSIEGELDAENPPGSTKSKSELLAVLPHQHFSESEGILDLTFTLAPSAFSTDEATRRRVSVKLVVDSAPGCGGIAWPAGQVAPLSLSVIYRRLR